MVAKGNNEQNKIAELLDSEGMNQKEFLSIYGDDCCVPSICMNPDCSFITTMEPDQDKGWCDECETNTVKSGLILLGVI